MDRLFVMRAADGASLVLSENPAGRRPFALEDGTRVEPVGWSGYAPQSGGE